MKLQFKKSQDLIFVDKPSGFSTHSDDPSQPGMRELFEKELCSKLFLIPGLDYGLSRPATGAVIFALNQVKADELAQQLQTSQVRQKYLFVTQQSSTQSSTQSRFELSTTFERVKRTPFFELWEATTTADHCAKILHLAQSIGLSVLGSADFLFPHFCLHLSEIHLPGEVPFLSPAPRVFERLGSLKDPTLVTWLSEVDRRQRLYGFLSQSKESLRLIHTDKFRVDLLGPQLWMYWHGSEVPNLSDLERVEALSRHLGRPYLLKKMQNRGANPAEKVEWLSSEWNLNWQATENEAVYQFSSERGQSPGLFLDQRANRSQLHLESKQKTVLNLFAYTCGFSLVAALGGATHVTSVDVSKTFLDWGKENFHLNKLNSDKYEFFCQDSLLFLKGCLKRQRRFDFIICDPPSFGRNKDQVFKLEQDLDFLLISTWNCLEEGGKMLFSCNLEKWTMKTLRTRIQKALPHAKIEAANRGWDFELPGQEPLLKAFTLRKLRPLR